MAASKHRWQFAVRFRRNAFGWGSQPAIARVHEAISRDQKSGAPRPDVGRRGCGAVFQRKAIKRGLYFSSAICDPAWLQKSANSNADLKVLHDQFTGLGNVVGAHNATVWFFRRSSTDPSDYDGERASNYCVTYRLTAAASPVVVVTTEYPVPFGTLYGMLEATGNCVHVSLHGLNSADVDTLIGLLSDQIGLGELDQQQIDSKKILALLGEPFEKYSDEGW